MAKPRKRRTPTKKKQAKHKRRYFRAAMLFLLLLALLGLGGYIAYLDHVVTDKFEGKRWAVPSRVYARALELYPGKVLPIEQLQSELNLIGYQTSFNGLESGSYLRHGNRFTITSRRFLHWDGEEPGRAVQLTISNSRITRLQDARSGDDVALMRLEPMQIGMIYPAHREDRVLVRLDELPPTLLNALQAVEDRDFQHHIGIDFRGIARALLANLKAGGVVQGGSTLTQQLVKNFYLSSERTLSRKLKEALMALLLEFHYSKDEILEAYANEIYLGQAGSRAIHGFGLASEFYFNKPVSELTLAQSALLVAILRGPAYYDPRRHPERAMDRRDQVINTLLKDGLVSPRQARQAINSPVGVTARIQRGGGRYPAFIDLVKRQLRQSYREEDLRSEGLRIFTSLDPIAQRLAERSLSQWGERLERDYRIPPKTLEGGIVLTRTGSAEVVALVGGRNARFEGFNRALDTRRPVGSLLKPALYLSALERGYTLATPISDEPIEVEGTKGEIWRPQNYDHSSHAAVPLIDALAHSYNLAAVNLGMALGIDQTVQTLYDLGIEKNLPSYPSLLLGAVEMAPIDIAQLYQTLADEGFYTPLRAVREVLDPRGRPLQRYPLETQQRFDAETVALINVALEEALRRGTGQRVARTLPADIYLAGKTGTTDELRDSWFAGFGREHLAVVWLGGDRNEKIGLTGAGGALKVWGEIMAALETPAPRPPLPPAIEWLEIDLESGLRGGGGCEKRRTLPFIHGTAPERFAPCAGGPVERSVGNFWNRLKGWLR